MKTIKHPIKTNRSQQQKISPKVVLVTGASAGIGKAVCLKYLQNNYIVLGVARRKNLLDKIANEYPNKFFGVACDVTQTQEIVSLINALPYQLKDIDILVNNAGLALGLNPVNQCDLADWKQMIDVNILALVNLTQVVSAEMAKKHNGYIVNLGSVAGDYPYPGGNIYGATKAFVKQFSKELRADLVAHNIRVTNIEPGLVGKTEFSNVRFKGDKKLAQHVYDEYTSLLPEDIAALIFMATQMPERVNINRIEVMSSSQSFGPIKILKNSELMPQNSSKKTK